MSMTAELADGRKLEFPDGTDPAVIQSTVKKMLGAPAAPVERPASFTDRLAGNPASRLIQGAVVDPVLGLAQAGANAVSPQAGQKINDFIKAKEDAKQRGMAAGGAGNDFGPDFDVMGLLGNLYPAGAISKAVTKALPLTTIPGRAIQGAASGGAIAAATPVTQGNDYWSDKGAQVGFGAATGGLVPPATELMRGGYNMGKRLLDPATMLRRAQNEMLGNNPGAKAKIIQALTNAKEIVPGSKPTAGEALADIPEATGIMSHEKTLRKATGISPQFTVRDAEQKAARLDLIDSIAKPDPAVGPGNMERALAERTAATQPMREQAIGFANIGNQNIPRLLGQQQDRQQAVVNALQQRGQFQAMSNAAQPTTLRISPTVDMASKQSMRPVQEAAPSERLKTAVETALERTAPIKPQVPETPLRSQSEIASRKLATEFESGTTRRNADIALEAKTAAKEAGQVLSDRKAERDLVTGALDNLQGAGLKELKAGDISARIQGLRSVPGIRSSDVASKALTELEGKIKGLANEHGNIDARDVYTIRKEAGNVIQKYADENKNFDQRMTAGLVKDVQGYLDDAIEGAGGKGWKDYLKKYGEMSGPVNQMEVGRTLKDALTSPLDVGKERAGVFASAVRDAPRTIKKSTGQSRYDQLSDVLTPEQSSKVNAVSEELARQERFKGLAMKTNLSGGNALAEEAHIPNLLSRPAAIANILMKHVQGDTNLKMNRMAAEQYLHPEQLAAALQDIPPSAKQQMVEAIMKRAGVPLSVGSARQF